MTNDDVIIQATDIDEEGVWHWDGKEMPLLGNHVPIPDNVRLDMDPKRQEVLMITDAKGWLEMCPACGTEPAPGIILVTEYTKIYPAHCCNKMVWMTDERDNNEIYEA